MAVEQFVTVNDFTVKGDFASQAGSKIINTESVLYRRTICGIKLTRGKQTESLFSYYDVTGKKLVTTNTTGKEALDASLVDMVEIESYDLKKENLISLIAQKQCENIQVKVSFVLSLAIERSARYAAQKQFFYELFHDGSLVGITNQAGYDIVKGGVI